MTTTAATRLPPRTTPTDVRGEDRVLLHGIDWETYRRLCDAKGDQRVLVAYDRGVLELMSPGTFHERSKTLLEHFLVAVARELQVPLVAMGSTLWNDAEAERGLEPDDCFYFEPEKIAASFQQSNAPSDYPFPDLAIEIDLRAGALDRARIYASLGVSEVWRFDGETLRIDRLRDGGSYESVTESRFLPLRAAEIGPWIRRGSECDLITWSLQVAAWARQELGPRRRGGEPA